MPKASDVIVKKTYFPALWGVFLLFGLYLVSLYNYLLFHCLAEMFGILVAFSIAMLTWNSRRFLDNSFLLFIGIAYLFVGLLDLVHTLAYKGMGVFEGAGTNLATELWIAARYVESLSLLVAAFFLGRRVKVNLLLLGYTLVVCFILGSIFWWDIFPQCFVEGTGLTPFKKISEYAICLLLAAAIIVLYRQRFEFDTVVIRLLAASIALTIASELAFTFYVHAYGLPNLIGHFLKIASYYLVYRAIIQTGLRRPYALLFRNLNWAKERLQEAHDQLEVRVEERTAELLEANRVLKEEIDQRQRAQEELRASEGQLRRLSTQLLQAQEDERKRIARELHDGVGQSLAAAKFTVERALGIIRQGPPQAGIELLDALVLTIQRAIEEARKTQMDLRPPMLDDLGIVSTISWFGREFEKIYAHIRVGMKLDIEEAAVPRPLKVTIFRVMQEALNNVAKHSGSEAATVLLSSEEGRIELVIQDDGRGFDVRGGVSPGEGPPEGFGLTSMKERIELSGGSFSIESGTGQGTRIRAVWQPQPPEIS